jgi:hypothetical protein
MGIIMLQCYYIICDVLLMMFYQLQASMYRTPKTSQAVSNLGTGIIYLMALLTRGILKHEPRTRTGSLKIPSASVGFH